MGQRWQGIAWRLQWRGGCRGRQTRGLGWRWCAWRWRCRRQWWIWRRHSGREGRSPWRRRRLARAHPRRRLAELLAGTRALKRAVGVLANVDLRSVDAVTAVDAKPVAIVRLPLIGRPPDQIVDTRAKRPSRIARCPTALICAAVRVPYHAPLDTFTAAGKRLALRRRGPAAILVAADLTDRPCLLANAFCHADRLEWRRRR